MPSNWHIAAASADVGRTPRAVKVAGVAIVLFRRQDGAMAALEDRCAHENVALSTGKIVGDEIECEHHGLRFDCSGKCTYMPAQKNIPSRFVVRSFLVDERDGQVFVVMPSAP